MVNTGTKVSELVKFYFLKVTTRVSLLQAQFITQLMFNYHQFPAVNTEIKFLLYVCNCRLTVTVLSKMFCLLKTLRWFAFGKNSNNYYSKTLSISCLLIYKDSFVIILISLVFWIVLNNDYTSIVEKQQTMKSATVFLLLLIFYFHTNFAQNESMFTNSELYLLLY